LSSPHCIARVSLVRSLAYYLKSIHIFYSFGFARVQIKVAGWLHFAARAATDTERNEKRAGVSLESAAHTLASEFKFEQVHEYETCTNLPDGLCNQLIFLSPYETTFCRANGCCRFSTLAPISMLLLECARAPVNCRANWISVEPRFDHATRESCMIYCVLAYHRTWLSARHSAAAMCVRA
jgi:hypothetical protein